MWNRLGREDGGARGSDRRHGGEGWGRFGRHDGHADDHRGYRQSGTWWRRCYPRDYRRSYGDYGDHYGSYFGLYASLYYPRHHVVDYYYDPGYYYPSYASGYTTVYTTAPVTEQVYEETAYYPESVTTMTPESGGTGVAEAVGTVAPAPAEQSDADTANPEAATWIERGVAAFAARDYTAARDYYLRAIFADAGDGVAKLLYGLANVPLGEFELAAVAMRHALQNTTELVDNPIDLRGFYPDEETFKAHLTLLSDRVGEHPEDGHALLLLGYLHYATGDPEDAVQRFEQLSVLDGTDELAARLRDTAKRFVAAPAATPETE